MERFFLDIGNPFLRYHRQCSGKRGCAGSKRDCRGGGALCSSSHVRGGKTTYSEGKPSGFGGGVRQQRVQGGRVRDWSKEGIGEGGDDEEA